MNAVLKHKLEFKKTELPVFVDKMKEIVGEQQKGMQSCHLQLFILAFICKVLFWFCDHGISICTCHINLLENLIHIRNNLHMGKM